jgi:hypothetical protein
VRFLWIAIVLAGCGQGLGGSSCARNSDCASGHCLEPGVCSALNDAAVDAEPDAYAVDIPPNLPDDAGL